MIMQFRLQGSEIGHTFKTAHHIAEFPDSHDRIEGFSTGNIMLMNIMVQDPQHTAGLRHTISKNFLNSQYHYLGINSGPHWYSQNHIGVTAWPSSQYDVCPQMLGNQIYFPLIIGNVTQRIPKLRDLLLCAKNSPCVYWIKSAGCHWMPRPPRFYQGFECWTDRKETLHQVWPT